MAAKTSAIDESVDDGVPDDFFDDILNDDLMMNLNVIDEWKSGDSNPPAPTAKEVQAAKRQERQEKKQEDVNRFNLLWKIDSKPKKDTKKPEVSRNVLDESRRSNRLEDRSKRRHSNTPSPPGDEGRNTRLLDEAGPSRITAFEDRERELRRIERHRNRRSRSRSPVRTRSPRYRRSRSRSRSSERRRRSRSPRPRRGSSRDRFRNGDGHKKTGLSFIEELAKTFAEKGQTFPELEQLKSNIQQPVSYPIPNPMYPYPSFTPHPSPFPNQNYPVPMMAPGFNYDPNMVMHNPMMNPMMHINPMMPMTVPQQQQPPTTPDPFAALVSPSSSYSPQSKYDSAKKKTTNIDVEEITSQLFLENKINLSDFLASKVSGSTGILSAKSNKSKVIANLKEAISALDNHESKNYTAKFMHVAPTYYFDLMKDDFRSPLIWNKHNVHYRYTSTSKEVEMCEPFKNVPTKMKQLIDLLGLDEGIISKRIFKRREDEKLLGDIKDSQKAQEKYSNKSNVSLVTSPKRLCDRSAQTDVFKCKECTIRSNKQLINEGTQTVGRTKMVDQAIQAEERDLNSSDTITALTSRQINVINEMKKFMLKNNSMGTLSNIRDDLASELRYTHNPDLEEGLNYISQLAARKEANAFRYAGGAPKAMSTFVNAHRSIDFDAINNSMIRPAGFKEDNRNNKKNNKKAWPYNIH